MKTNYRRTSLVIIIVAALVAFMLPAAARAQTETILFVNPATANATTCPSSTITIAISVEDVEDLTAFHLEISFDPAVIQVVEDGIEPAEFIIGEGETYLPEPTNEIDNVNGFISWGLAKQGTGGDPNPVDGDGDLIEITLYALVPNASSEIDIDEDNSILVNWPDAFEIPFEATDGVVNTSSCPPTDIDLSNNTIQENQPAGTTIGTFSSTDPDGDTAFTYELVDTEHYPDNAAFTITGNTLKSAVSFNYEVKDSYHIRVRTTDPWGAYYEEVFSIVIIDVNDAPVLAPIGNKTASEGVLLTFDAEATDEDEGQTLTFSLTGAPDDASIDPTTGVFTWTPREEDGGQSFTFTVCVSDSVFSDCETITVTVNEVNSPPVLDPIEPKTVNELATLNFTATATDSDIPVQTLTFSLADGVGGDVPEGAGIDPSSGVFSWTPTEAQGPGEYTFDVCVSDGALSDCETITVTVDEVNVAPVLAEIGDKIIAELALLSFNASATDADLPAQPLVFSLADGVGGEVPEGAGIDPSSGVFSWTPTEAQGPGEYTFDVCVSDGALSDCETITVTVTEVNVAPVLAEIGDKTIAELALLSFNASASDADLPEQPLVFSLAGEVPEGAAISSEGAFSWTPTEAQGPGEYTFDVCVSDGALSDCETITVTVSEVNIAPVLAEIEDQSVAELVLLTFTATASDADLPAQTLVFSLADGVGGDVPEGALITDEGVFSWTPTEAQGPGVYTFDVCVTDSYSGSDCETITITVSEVNVAPVLAPIGDQFVAELDTLTFTAKASDADIPAQTLVFSLADGVGGDVPEGAGIDPSSGVFSWTPTEDQGPGVYTFDVCVSDGELNDCETITVTVSEVNVAPVLGEIGDKTINELSKLAFTATATDINLPPQTLTFSLVGAPTGAAIDPTTGAFSWTPSEEQGPGDYTFTVKVCDDGTPSLCDEEEITVTVNEVNEAPVAVNDTYATVKNQVITILPPGVMTNDTDADIPANTLTAVLVTGIPAGEGILIFAPSGAFSYTPPTDFLGTTSFTYKVFDGSVYSNIATVSITVTEGNLPPTDITMTDQTILENQPIGTVVSYLSSVDPNLGDTFTYSLVSGTGDADNGSFSISGNQLLSAAVFDYETKSNYTIRIRSTDQGGRYFEKSFVITILNVNDPPVANNQSVTTPEDTTLPITLTGSDQDGDLLSFAVIAQPLHGILTGTAPNLTYTPAENYNGSDSFTFNANDGNLVSNTATVSITVTAVNDAPVAHDKSVATLEDTPITISLDASDVDGDPLNVIMVTSPEHGNVTISGLVVIYEPSPNYYGTDSFRYKVNDGTVDSNTATVSITITPVNDPPVAEDLVLETIENQAIEFELLASDPDGDSLNYSITLSPEHGNVSCSGINCTYTPEAGWSGTDSFTYIANDGELDSNEATVEIIVHPLPVFRIYLPLILK
jgi:hypothetical protein